MNKTPLDEKDDMYMLLVTGATLCTNQQLWENYWQKRNRNASFMLQANQHPK